MRVELQQLVGHVLHGLLHARLGLGPLLRAELVQYRRGPGIGGAVFLDQVEARERHVEARGSANSRIMNSTFEAILHDLFQAVVAGDAVLDVDNVVADGEVAEVGDEGGGLRLGRLGSGRAATSASSERSLAPKRMRFASGKLTPLAMAVRTMMGVRISPAR